MEVPLIVQVLQLELQLLQIVLLIPNPAGQEVSQVPLV